MKLRNALLAATILAAPIAVSAQPVSGLYIGAGAGGNILQDETVSHTAGFPRATGGLPNRDGPGSNIKFDAGPVVIGSVGYGLGNGLRLELQGAFYDNKLKGFKNGAPTSAGGDEYKEGAFFNVFYDLAVPGIPVQPYVGVGGGYVHNQFNSLRITSISANQILRGNGENDNIGVQGIAGFAFPIKTIPGLALTAEYRFLAEPNGRDYKEQLFNTQGAFGVRVKEGADDFNHSILLGVRFAFGAPQPAPAAPGRPAGSGPGSRPHLPRLLRLGSGGPDRPRAPDRGRGGAGQHPDAVHADRSAGQRRPLRHRSLQPAPVLAACADRGRRAGAFGRAAHLDRHPGLRRHPPAGADRAWRA